MTTTRLITAALMFAVTILSASADSDTDAIRKLMAGQFDKPEQRLSVDPIAVAGDHAIAGWVQGDMGGRALLRRKGHDWQIVLCAGDHIRTADALQKVGLAAAVARDLAHRLAAAEAKTDPARLAMFAKFDSILMLDGSGQHPPGHHGGGHHPPASKPAGH
jgi:hypothetical protein